MITPKQMIQRMPVLIKNMTGMKMNVFDILEQDHIKVEGLYLMYRMSDEKQRTKLVATIKKEIETHASLEEKHFYPVCERFPKLKGYVKHSFKEHGEIKQILSKISGSSGSEQQSLVQELMSTVAHHVREEENEFFPACRDVLPEEEIERISNIFRKAKGLRQTGGSVSRRPKVSSRGVTGRKSSSRSRRAA